MGRPPIGARAMTEAERKRRQRALKQVRRKDPAKPLLAPPGYNELLEDEMHPDAITPEQQYTWAVSSLLGHVIAAPAYWRELFGDSEPTPSPELLALFDQAIEELQRYKKRKQKAFL